MSEADPIIPYADMDSLPDALKAPLEAYEKRMGFLPNALKLYMHRPELLGLLVQLNNTVMRDPSSHLDVGLKRRIAAVCSAVNKSAYCVAHNTNTLKTETESDGEGWGYTDDDVRALLDPDFEPDDPVEKACFAFARAATEDPSDVPREAVEGIARVLTPPQVVELACVVGFWKFYNTVHESLYIPLEDELLAGDEISADELRGEGVASNTPSAPVVAEIDVYASEGCPFCRRAKRMLTAKGATFREIVIGDDEENFAEMIVRAGGRETVPQIFIDGNHIGGMDEMAALERAGKLNDLLTRAGGA